LRTAIRRFRPDLLHAQYGTMTAFFSSLCSPLPLVVTFRGSDLLGYSRRPTLRSLAATMLSQAAAFRATEVICVSEQLRDHLIFGKASASIIPSGVDTGIFFPRPRNDARRHLAWNCDERIVLLNAGRDPQLKRLDLAQRAVAFAQTICGPIRFVVLDGDTPPDTIPFVMCAADCLLHTSDSEGSPNIVKEAMACNLPVVSVDVGDVRERLAGVSASCIVDRRFDAIGGALATILSDGQRSDGFSKIHDVSGRIVAERILEVYRRALGDRVHEPVRIVRKALKCESREA
jgi:glycosyltransferase involved in cell wall biosynthesis